MDRGPDWRVAGWPERVRRAVGLELVRLLDLSNLAEVFAAARARLAKEAEQRAGRLSKTTRPKRN